MPQALVAAQDALIEAADAKQQALVSIDMQALVAEWQQVLLLIASVLVIKTVVLLALCLLFGTALPDSIRTAFSLAQVGEFAFVLFSAAAAAGLMSSRGVTIGFLTIAGSMILTPLMAGLGDRLASRLHRGPAFAPGAYATEFSDHLVVVGMDNVGHLIALMAERTGVPYIAFDNDYQTVMQGKRAGRNVHFGDIYSRAVQEAAGLAHARTAFISTTDMHRLKGIALTLHNNYPALDIYARVETIEDQNELRAKGINKAATSFIESTLFRGSTLLKEMGVAEDAVDTLLDSLRADQYEPVMQALSAVLDAGSEGRA